ncbi:hypothetical protein [Bradyrhizobium sp. th.b2]|uniref:hypothetical protein n=1 Tax=Bradyrhizobium sp. th-b2 TaxID=172088 RepID=UPI00048C4BD8|nr:hypothetical protein [Bradyrhizobium sp. th.b2]
MSVIEIVMEGGLIQSVKAPTGTTVRVYDYDVEGSSQKKQVDPDGDEFIEFVHKGTGDWD